VCAPEARAGPSWSSNHPGRGQARAGSPQIVRSPGSTRFLVQDVGPLLPISPFFAEDSPTEVPCRRQLRLSPDLWFTRPARFGAGSSRPARRRPWSPAGDGARRRTSPWTARHHQACAVTVPPPSPDPSPAAPPRPPPPPPRAARIPRRRRRGRGHANSSPAAGGEGAAPPAGTRLSWKLSGEAISGNEPWRDLTRDVVVFLPWASILRGRVAPTGGQCCARAVVGGGEPCSPRQALRPSRRHRLALAEHDSAWACWYRPSQLPGPPTCPLWKLGAETPGADRSLDGQRGPGSLHPSPRGPSRHPGEGGRGRDPFSTPPGVPGCPVLPPRDTCLRPAALDNFGAARGCSTGHAGWIGAGMTRTRRTIRGYDPVHPDRLQRVSAPRAEVLHGRDRRDACLHGHGLPCRCSDP